MGQHLEEFFGSDAAAAGVYKLSLIQRRMCSGSLREVAASNVLAKHLWVAEFAGGELEAASVQEANSDHGVSPLCTGSSADEGAGDKQTVDTVFQEFLKVRHGDRARLPF